MILARAYFPSDFNPFRDAASIVLFLLFIGFFAFGFFIIYKQVALVKKEEFGLIDVLQCLFFGFIFSSSISIVVGMAVIFAVEEPSFWENSATPPPEINPLFLIIPLLVCLIYISIYPLIDFLYIALNEENEEGLTPFHKFLAKNVFNRFSDKKFRIVAAIVLYCIIIVPPFIFWAYGMYVGPTVIPFIMILITFTITYPLIVLTFYGSKGYISGLTNVYYHLPDLKRSLFLSFEDGKRSMKEFAADPGPRILLGLMLFVFVWAWISMIQTISFYFSGKMAISPYSYAGMVFVTLLFGILGFFTRYFNRQIKYKAIHTLFASCLMAAVGINVLVNFMIVNSTKLKSTFDYGIFGMHELVPNYLLFAFPAVIEEVVLIIFTSYYFFSKKNEYTNNVKYAKITECGQIFDPIPLFNFIKSDDPKVQEHAIKTLTLMFERIPIKGGIDLNKFKFKHSLMDGICDPNPVAQRVCYSILVQLEKDVPDIVFPWILEALESPNYNKSVPVAQSLLTADLHLLEKLPTNLIFTLINDSEWRIKLYALRLFSRLVKMNKELILKLIEKRYILNNLVNDFDSQIQVEVLNLLADTEVVLPSKSIIEKLNHSNKEIRAAAIRNLKNLDIQHIDPQMISKLIPLTKDPTSSVRASIFEAFAKIGNFREFFIPILPFLDGLTDVNKDVRDSSVLAIQKYFDEEPNALDIDIIINKIDPNNNDTITSVLSLLGKLWDKNPQKILTTLLIFIKFENEQLKESISNILVEKYQTQPDLILQSLLAVPDVSKFVTKGIVSKTIINIAKRDPKKVVPILIDALNSNEDEAKANAIASLDGLVDDFIDLIDIKRILMLLQSEKNKLFAKEASKIIAKIAKKNPALIKPVMSVILLTLNQQEQSTKIVLSKSLLEIAKESPDIIPVRPIIKLLSESDPFIRESGAKILGFVGNKANEESIDALLNQGLSDNEWIVREATISSLGKLIENVENKEPIINKLVSLIDDEQIWVQIAAINMLSSIKAVKASQIPFEKLSKSVSSEDQKIRESSAGLIKIYANQIDRVFDKILILLEDTSEEVRNKMINTMVEIIQMIKLETILTPLLKNLSEESSIGIQRSIALILGRTVKYEDEKIKKRVISLLKIRCEMSQDPIICSTLHQLKEN